MDSFFIFFSVFYCVLKMRYFISVIVFSTLLPSSTAMLSPILIVLIFIYRILFRTVLRVLGFQFHVPGFTPRDSFRFILTVVEFMILFISPPVLEFTFHAR